MSTLNVDKIDPNTGTALEIGSSGDTVTVPTGAVFKSVDKVETDKLDPESGTALEIGTSGDTVNVPSGVTLDLNAGATLDATGATVTGITTSDIDWQAVQTSSPITGAAGKGYPINTTSGEITLNLPAGTAGDQVAFIDYAGTFDSNKLTITPNGSEKIKGVADSQTADTERQAGTLVYVDSTQGWILSSAAPDPGLTPPLFVAATGGTITTDGDYKVHRFTGSGTFAVSSAGNAGGSNTVDYMIVAGGGGGSEDYGGGGGAGGYRESVPSPAAWTASPLAASAGALPVAATPYAVTVGSGGIALDYPHTPPAGNGTNSVWSSITSAGGGGGGTGYPGGDGAPGGSGGGGNGGYSKAGGTGNDPPVSPAQGTNGGPYSPPAYAGGGGGGANPPSAPAPDGPKHGYKGTTTHITGSPVSLAGGGGGGAGPQAAGTGFDGGGPGGHYPGHSPGTAGTANTGGGGGGASEEPTSAAAGGSGVVVLRYKFQ